MRQRGFSVRFNLILIVLTLIAFMLNNEPFSLFVALIWAFKFLFKLFKAAAEGGAFD